MNHTSIDLRICSGLDSSSEPAAFQVQLISVGIVHLYHQYFGFAFRSFNVGAACWFSYIRSGVKIPSNLHNNLQAAVQNPIAVFNAIHTILIAVKACITWGYTVIVHNFTLSHFCTYQSTLLLLHVYMYVIAYLHLGLVIYSCTSCCCCCKFCCCCMHSLMHRLKQEYYDMTS